MANRVDDNIVHIYWSQLCILYKAVLVHAFQINTAHKISLAP